jgi:hypothetical protein
MVEYTLEIGYPQDPFLVCDFDLGQLRVERLMDSDFQWEDLEEGDPLLSLSLSDIQRIINGLNLSFDERSAVCDRIALLRKLISPFAWRVKLESTVGDATRMLADRYDAAVANKLQREQWMDEVELLIAPARLVQPELDTLRALQAVMPRRIRVMRK